MDSPIVFKHRASTSITGMPGVHNLVDTTLCTRGIVHSFRPSWGPSCTIFAKSHKLITDYGHYELNS